MKQLRGAVVLVIITGLMSMLSVHLGSQAAWAAAKGILRIAVVGFDRESPALWEGSTPMLPYSGNMYDPLIAADDHGQLSTEGLVTGWHVNDTGDVVTLTIRPGVKFHNGEPLTAEDIKFSFETWQEQTGGSPSLTGAALRDILKRVEVVNDLQVQVSLHSPNAIFPHLLSWVEGDFGVLPKRYFESLPGQTFEEKRDAFVKQLITGPGVAGYDSNAPTYPYDPKEARRLLQEIGYLKNPKTIIANSFSFASLPEGPKFIEAIAGYWEAVGIKVQIRQVDATFMHHPGLWQAPVRRTCWGPTVSGATC